MVPKQIKGTPKEYRSTSGSWLTSGPLFRSFASGLLIYGRQLWNDKKLENEHFKKYPYEQLTCDELEKFIEIIETAKLFGKRIGEYSNILTLYFIFSPSVPRTALIGPRIHST